MGLEGLAAISAIGSSVANITRSVAPIVSGVGATVGAVQEGRATQQAQEYNARISEIEAGVAGESAARSDLNAQIARNAAGIEVSRTLEAGRKVQGAQAAVAAHTGLVATEGSPLLAQLETIRRANEDAVLSRWKGDVTATGFEAEASQKRLQADALRAEAQMRRIEGRRAILAGYTRASKELTGATERLANFKWPVAPGPEMPVRDLFGGANYT